MTTYDKGDYCLRTSLFCAGKLMQGINDIIGVMNTMIFECRLTSYYPVKSQEYMWSNSGSENEEENTFWKRPTFWLWRHLGIDMHKGLNGDQFRAFFIMMYLNKDNPLYKRIWKKIAVGFILRLGFTPSLCEWAPLKPQAYVLYFKSAPGIYKYLCYPLYLICRLFFEIIYMEENVFIPIEQSTTNKISLFPTAHLLGKVLPVQCYVELVYKTYFKGDIEFIGQSVIDGLVKAHYENIQ